MPGQFTEDVKIGILHVYYVKVDLHFLEDGFRYVSIFSASLCLTAGPIHASVAEALDVYTVFFVKVDD